MAKIRTTIVDGNIAPLTECGTSGDEGAEVIFHGRVRRMEAGREISGLYYEHYEDMAESALSDLAHETAERHAIAELLCIHRVGMVPCGESSLRVQIASPHRREALDAMDWFITELKKRVPIWKWGVLEDGTRFPGEGGQLPMNPEMKSQ